MLIATTNEVPGYTTTRMLGEVFGVTVRRLDFGNTLTAGFSSMSGGEVPQLTSLVVQSRNQAMGRLVDAARRRGANAVVGMRFDTGDMSGTLSEICAYGTAVWVEPATDEARAQYGALVEAGRVPPAPPH
ncbi:MAG TPA: YbjQ family protein [Actinocatenispora sp.]